MPLYPFILLGGLLVVLIVMPPLLAAYIDYRREGVRERRVAADRSKGGSHRG